MTVDTMRKVDFYAGVPLCFVLTWLHRLLFWWRPRSRRRPQRVLLIELSEMGSAILVDPAMEKLKQQGCELYFVIFKKNKPSLDILGTVPEQNIFLMRDDGLFSLAGDTFRFLWWCRRKQIDSAIDLELFSRFTALLTALCGSQHNVGFYKFHNEGLYRGDFLTKKVAYNSHIHIAKNFIALVNALLAESEELPYSKLPVSAAEIRLKKAVIGEDIKNMVREKIRVNYPAWNGESIFLINANASDMLPQRRWPQTYFEELIGNLLKNHSDILILLTGSPTERAGLQKIVDGVNNERCVNFAGEVKFAELLALYSISAVMISNDSGPPHFASVTDLHSFVLFGPETPSLYGSLGNTTTITAGLACSPCVSAWNHRKTPCSDNQCLKRIYPDQVLALVSQYYQSKSGNKPAERRAEVVTENVVLN